MLGRLLVIGGACATLAACGTDRSAPTQPPARARQLGASGSITITTHGRAAAFSAATSSSGPSGAALDRGGAPAGVATLPLAFVRGDGRHLFARDGRYRRSVRFNDPQGARHELVALYDRQGAPPRVIQHYVEGKLVRVTAMRWRRTAAGWAQERVLSREIRGDTLAFEAEARATSMDLSMGTRPFTTRVLAALAGGLGYVFAPRDASAQLYLSECWEQYKRYWTATAALTSTILAIEVGIESGLGAAAMNALYFAYSAALAAAIIAEMDLYICVENAKARDAGSTTGSTPPPSGGTGDLNAPDEDCLDGSYAAHCQTPTTL